MLSLLLNMNSFLNKNVLIVSILGFALLATGVPVGGAIYATEDEIEELQDDVNTIQETLNTLVLTLDETVQGGQYECTPIVVPPTINETVITPPPCVQPLQPPPPEPVEPEQNVTAPCPYAPIEEPEPNVTEPSLPCPYAPPVEQQNNVTEPETIPFLPPINITEPTIVEQQPECPPSSPIVIESEEPNMVYDLECHCFVNEVPTNGTTIN